MLGTTLQDFRAFAGRAEQQTEEFLDEYVEPVLDRYRELVGGLDTTLSV